MAVADGSRGVADAGLKVRDLVAYRNQDASRAEVTAHLGMFVFLASWAMLFASLFFSYGLVRARAASWPPPGEPPLPLVLPGLNTALAALSSAAVHDAVRSVRVQHGRRAAWALAAATVLGTLFLVLQAVVWVRLYRGGLVPSGGTYASVFYALTSFHALHVVVGLVALAWFTARAFLGIRRLRPTPIRLWGMYWHFVAAVWLVLFTTVYVL